MEEKESVRNLSYGLDRDEFAAALVGDDSELELVDEEELHRRSDEALLGEDVGGRDRVHDPTRALEGGGEVHREGATITTYQYIHESTPQGENERSELDGGVPNDKVKMWKGTVQGF